MNLFALKSGAIFGALGVIIGAFGAHGLKDKLPPYSLEIYHTGVTYQFYHALALLATGVLANWFPGKTNQWAAYCFFIGTVLFSGSLYLLAIAKASTDKYNFLGAITPFGGVSFIIGWILLFISFIKK